MAVRRWRRCDGGAAMVAAMAALRVDITDDLTASLHEAAAIVRGEAKPARIWQLPAGIDVRALRRRRGLSQVAFAHRLGFSPAAVRDWKQGRRRPDLARRLLPVIAHRRSSRTAAGRRAPARGGGEALHAGNPEAA